MSIVTYVDMEYITYPIPYVNTITFLKDYVYQYRVGKSPKCKYKKHAEKCFTSFNGYLCPHYFLPEYERRVG